MSIDWHFAAVSAVAAQMSDSLNLSPLKEVQHVCSSGVIYSTELRLKKIIFQFPVGHIEVSSSAPHTVTAGTKVPTVDNVTPLGIQGPLFKWK